jgi:hypothetical protein
MKKHKFYTSNFINFYKLNNPAIVGNVILVDYEISDLGEHYSAIENGVVEYIAKDKILLEIIYNSSEFDLNKRGIVFKKTKVIS